MLRVHFAPLQLGVSTLIGCTASETIKAQFDKNKKERINSIKCYIVDKN